jgi:outer membrane biosynthesis protein TonB
MNHWRLLFIAVLVATLQGQSPPTETPYTIGPDVSAPRVISKVDAGYTREAMEARREGDVLIELVVTRDGKASDVHETGKPVGCGLDESAIMAVA